MYPIIIRCAEKKDEKNNPPLLSTQNRPCKADELKTVNLGEQSQGDSIAIILVNDS